MANDEQWKAVHRIGAPYMIFGGIAAFAGSLAIFPFAVFGSLPDVAELEAGTKGGGRWFADTATTSSGAQPLRVYVSFGSVWVVRTPNSLESVRSNVRGVRGMGGIPSPALPSFARHTLCVCV